MRISKKMQAILEWMACNDCGVSSKTMVGIHFRIPVDCRFDAPFDSGDFGRCVRVVQKFPEIRKSFDRIAHQVPQFAGILREWDGLCNAYGATNGEYNRSLSDRIWELRQDKSKWVEIAPNAFVKEFRS